MKHLTLFSLIILTGVLAQSLCVRVGHVGAGPANLTGLLSVLGSARPVRTSLDAGWIWSQRLQAQLFDRCLKAGRSSK